MNPEHPPLAKLLCAAPLLAMNLRLPTEDPVWNARDELNFGALFLYTNHRSADDILFPARCVTIALTALLGLSIACWTRLRFGPLAACIALTLFVLDPNITAHGRYVTTDLAVSLFSFLACIAWGHPLLAGLALGLALGSKFSALFLLPVFAIFAAIRWPGLKSISCTLLSAAGVVTVLYLGHLNVFVEGLRQLVEHGSKGHVSYLLGQISQTGWWYYFPVAFVLKWPVAVLALGTLALGLAIRRPAPPSLNVLVLLIPALVYCVFCLNSRLDIGIRHLSPILPPLYILMAVPLARHAPKWLIITALSLLAAESLSVYPNYLAFFNVLAGGPSQGPRYLLDSNIDWGQDTKKLKRWLDVRGVTRVCRVYFGQAILAHYGIEESALPGIDEPNAVRDLDCIAAASVTPLYGLYVPNDRYRWLRAHQPIAKIGYSIYVYDLRKQPTARDTSGPNDSIAASITH